MNTEKCVWYGARNEDGSLQIDLDGSYLSCYSSIEETKEALDRYIQEHNSEGKTYIICKTTYRKTLDENGRFVEAQSIIEAVETYRKEKETMNRIPSQTEVAQIRALYPAGTRLELIAMDDAYMHPSPGDQGTVQGVDDMGQIMMRWDNGSSLSLVPGYDKFKIAKGARR